VIQRIEIAFQGVIGFVFSREDAGAPGLSCKLRAPTPAGVFRMTEDGRSFAAAAPSGPSLSLFQVCGQSDAHPDASTNSLSFARSCAARFHLHASSPVFEGAPQ
jgi:hypothetical protein